MDDAEHGIFVAPEEREVAPQPQHELIGAEQAQRAHDAKNPDFSAPRRRASPVEGGSTQTVVGLIWLRRQAARDQAPLLAGRVAALERASDGSFRLDLREPGDRGADRAPGDRCRGCPAADRRSR